LIAKKLRVGWLVEPVEQTLLQVPRALVASGLAALLDLALLVVLVETAGWYPLAAATLSYLAGGVLQYYLCAVWVFPAAPEKVTTGFAAFTLLSLVGLGITWVVMALLHDGLHVNYAAAKVAALGLAFGWNFLSRKLLLFRPND
jgi:putative flippase GtrA